MLRTAVETFRRFAEAAGRDPGPLPIVVQVNGSVTTTPLDERAPLTGSIDQVADDLAQLSALVFSQRPCFARGYVAWDRRLPAGTRRPAGSRRSQSELLQTKPPDGALGAGHVVWSTVDSEPFDLTYTDLSGHARAGLLIARPMSFRGSRRFTS